MASCSGCNSGAGVRTLAAAQQILAKVSGITRNIDPVPLGF